MRLRAWLPAAVVLPVAAALCAMTAAREEAIPVCTCVNVGASWARDLGCSGAGSCANANLISGFFTCSTVTGTGPCPVSGSVTVTYHSCTTVVCSTEYYSSCSANCDAPALDPVDITNQSTVYPSVDACCETNCYYNFELWFFNAPTTTCAGQTLTLQNPPATAHCVWTQQFHCHPGV